MFGKTTAKRIVGGCLAALAAAGVGILSAAPAQAADEWVTLSSNPWYGDCRDFDDEITGALGHAEICWRGTDVYLPGGFAEDTEADGYHARLLVRYQIYTNGAWSGSHYRTYIKDYNSKDYRTPGAIVEARYPTANVHARICTYNGDTKVACGAWR